jgi:GR25 family glycosyltransferase involved in LPS biosynthesis
LNIKSPRASILVTAYNRPNLLAKVLESLSEYEGKIYLSIDYPKYSDETSLKNFNEILKLASNGSFNIFKTKISESNLGCYLGVTEAISWAFQDNEELIIIEDDIIVDSLFLDFANSCLIKYRDVKSIGSIGSSNLVPETSLLDPDLTCRLSIYSSSWGWATWKDRWKDFETDLNVFPKKRPAWPDNYWRPNQKFYWYRIWRKVNQGEVDSWAYRWLYSNFLRGRGSIMPNRNLSLNIGFGITATHTRDLTPPWWLPSRIDKSFLLCLDSGIPEYDAVADKWMEKYHFRMSTVNQLKNFIGEYFPLIRRIYSAYKKLILSTKNKLQFLI